MHTTRIPYASTASFSPLVLDYLHDSAFISSFFSQKPTLDGFIGQCEDRKNFSKEIRSVLVAQLKKQYTSLPLAEAERESLHARINLLDKESTFTVTTGHQLCLATGPLYTVYKILHVIRLAEALTEKMPGTTVLPIFWMATEDHDFAEVNHFRFAGEKRIWHAPSGDAVGRISTETVAPVLDELGKYMPQSDFAEQLLRDLRDAYLNQQNLADATRALVHRWFGHFGILCIDGDDAALKQFVIPCFSKELAEGVVFTEVSQTNNRLEKQYKVQVNPRDVNLFYLHNGHRNRIQQTADGFAEVGGKHLWKLPEILEELRVHPERFSPNVLLRPLYQETILPNLGYIGGGGEVAYWAQLKEMFAAFEVPFPVVILRQSVQLVPAKVARKLQKLNLKITDVYRPGGDLAAEWVGQEELEMLTLHQEKKRLASLFEEINEKAMQQDPTLIKHVAAQQAKALHALQGIAHKLERAAKRKHVDKMRMLEECRDILLPGGGLQERKDSILDHWLYFGPHLLTQIYSAIKPLEFELISLSEE